MIESAGPHIAADTKAAREACKLAFRWLVVVFVSLLVFYTLYAVVGTLDL